ncbi:MAG: hypothetical protein KGJ68_11275 [Gammaproteobacteria bacterium]|nr:hypothetical protein [Gammaproteobacteria bacterium]
MTSVAGSSPVASLEGRIRQDQVQLNDWTTCVSARTPKGQAAIQKLSGEISAAKAQIAQALQTQARAAQAPAAAAPARPGSLDVWA